MDPTNNNFLRQLAQLQAAYPMNVNDQNSYAAMQPQGQFQPPPLPIPLHEFAAMNMANYNQAMFEIIRNQLNFFWARQMLELNSSGAVKQHLLPLARIKRVMKANPAVKMISADTPIIISKACELFIMELAFRGWIYAEASDRRTLERSDVLNAIAQADIFHFLADML